MRVLGLALAAAVVLAVAAAGPGGRAHAGQAGEARQMRGELSSVDLDARTISARAADGLAWQFLFTDDTTISGAGDGAAGLAAMRGVTVTVTYTREAHAFVAWIIDIEPDR